MDSRLSQHLIVRFGGTNMIYRICRFLPRCYAYTLRGGVSGVRRVACAGADKFAAAKYLLSELAGGRDSLFARKVFTSFDARSFYRSFDYISRRNIIFKGIGLIPNNLFVSPL